MIEAERILLRNAIKDSLNKRFVFLSDRYLLPYQLENVFALQLLIILLAYCSCIPLYSFSYIYNYIMSAPTSFLDR